MSYKLQVMYMPSTGSTMDLTPPGPGWHIEKIFPMVTGSYETPNYNNTPVYQSNGATEMVREETNRSVSHSVYVGVLWKFYQPTNQDLNDAVTKDIREACTWG